MSPFLETLWSPAAMSLKTAGRDVALGARIFGRGAVGLTGVVTLFSALTLFGSQEVRERVTAAAAGLASFAPAAASTTAGDRAAVNEAPPDRWGDWIGVKPNKVAEPAEEHVTRYLSRRYRVAENAVRRIVGEAFRTGRAMGVEPLLILAVTAVESGMNPLAQSAMGAQGLMQVMTTVHSEKFAVHGGDDAALDPIANLRVGSEILRDLIRRGGSIERGLQLYVGAGNAADDGGYASRVLGEMARIKVAAAGDVRGALSAPGRTDGGSAAGREAATLVPVTATQAPSPASDETVHRAI